MSGVLKSYLVAKATKESNCNFDWWAYVDGLEIQLQSSAPTDGDEWILIDTIEVPIPKLDKQVLTPELVEKLEEQKSAIRARAELGVQRVQVQINELLALPDGVVVEE